MGCLGPAALKVIDHVLLWSLWLDRTCPCMLDKCDDQIPCCTRAMDPEPAFLLNVTHKQYCRDTDTWHACGRSECHHVRHCPSNPKVFECACKPMTPVEYNAVMNKEADFLHVNTPCNKVNASLSLKKWPSCSKFLKYRLDTPDTTCNMVPQLLLSAGRGPHPSMEVKWIANYSGFEIFHVDLSEARGFLAAECGEGTAKVFDQLPEGSLDSSRMVRTCALSRKGGVTFDDDVVFAGSLLDIVSTCSAATLGIGATIMEDSLHESPVMSVMAAHPGYPLVDCMLQQSLPLVYDAPSSWSKAALSFCYGTIDDASDVRITYRDTRDARWPYAGLVGRAGLLAFISNTVPVHPAALSTQISV